MKLRPAAEVAKDVVSLTEQFGVSPAIAVEILERDNEIRKATVEACKAAAKEMGFTHGGPKGLLAALDSVLEQK